MVAMAMYFYASRLTATAAAKTPPPSQPPVNSNKSSSSSSSTTGKRHQVPTTSASAVADERPVSREKVSAPGQRLLYQQQRARSFIGVRVPRNDGDR